jgi:hypothetical protein
MVARYSDRHTWSVVRTELEPDWQVASFHPEARPVSITLTSSSSEAESDWRSVLQDCSRPAGGSVMLQSFDDAMPSGRSIAPAAPNGSPLTNYSPTVPAIELASMTDQPVILPYLLGDLSHTVTASSATIAGSDSPTPSGPGGPGGGIGSPVPEPAAIPLMGMVISLMLRRRSTRQNPPS